MTDQKKEMGGPLVVYIMDRRRGRHMVTVYASYIQRGIAKWQIQVNGHANGELIMTHPRDVSFSCSFLVGSSVNQSFFAAAAVVVACSQSWWWCLLVLKMSGKLSTVHRM